MTIEMLDGGLGAASASKTDRGSKSATTVRTRSEVASETHLDVLRDLELVRHAIV